MTTSEMERISALMMDPILNPRVLEYHKRREEELLRQFSRYPEWFRKTPADELRDVLRKAAKGE